MKARLDDLYRAVAKELALSRNNSMLVTRAVIMCLGKLIAESDSFRIDRFGTFKHKVVGEHRVKHPSSQEWVVIPPHDKIMFTASEVMGQYNPRNGVSTITNAERAELIKFGDEEDFAEEQRAVIDEYLRKRRVYLKKAAKHRKAKKPQKHEYYKPKREENEIKE